MGVVGSLGFQKSFEPSTGTCMLIILDIFEDCPASHTLVRGTRKQNPLRMFRTGGRSRLAARHQVAA